MHHWKTLTVAMLICCVALLLSCSKDKPNQPQIPSTGMLHVTTTPPGAAIIIEGDSLGITPKTITADTGSHYLALELAGYDLWLDQITIRPGRTDTLPNVKLTERILSKITVTSTPLEANVLLNGTLVSKAPAIIMADTGRHTVRVETTGYVPWDTLLVLTQPETMAIHATLTKISGAIRVTSEPSGAEVSVDGGPSSGTTPLTVSDLIPGAHTVSVTDGGYDPWQTTVTVIAFDTVDVHATLSQQTGSLNVTSLPPGATISLDGNPTGSVTPMELSGISVGPHAIRLELNGYAVWDSTVQVTTGTTLVAASLVSLVGTIDVSSDPTGAVILLDGDSTGLVTPAVLENVPVGQREVIIVLEGYAPEYNYVTVETGQTHYINAVLREKLGAIMVTSDPTAADIYIDGNATGWQAPHLFDSLKEETIEITCRQDGYRDETISVTPMAFDTLNVHLNLLFIAGYLNCISTPTGADISINGQPTGKTTTASLTYPPGTYTVTYSYPKYYDWDTTVTIEAFVTYTLDAQLEPHPGSLLVVSNPSGADIYINGQNTGMLTPFMFHEISAGTHSILIHLDGHYRSDHTVNVYSDSLSEVTANLIEAPDFYYAVTFGNHIYLAHADGMIHDTLATDYDDYISSYVSHVGEFRWSPDAQYFLYTGDNYAVTLCESDGTFVRGFSGNRSTDFYWAPGSDEFMYSKYCGPIYRYQLATNWYTTFVSGCYVHCPAYSPAGNRILYSVNNYGTRCWINVINLDGSGKRTVYGQFGSGFDENLSIVWLTDTTAVFKAGGRGLYHIKVPYSGNATVTHVINDDISRFRLSENGQHGAYQAGDGLYYFEVGAWNPRPVSQIGVWDFDISPDGQYIIGLASNGVHMLNTNDMSDVRAIKRSNTNRGTVKVRPQ